MGTYKLLALDMDGTLLTDEKTISESSVTALGRASGAGMTCALSTGRAISELADYRAQLDGVVRYASLLSGAHVADLVGPRTLDVHPIPEELVYAVAEQGLAEHAMVQLFTARSAVMTRSDVARMPEIGQGAYQQLALEHGTLIDEVMPYLASHGHEILKINLHHVDAASHARSRQALRRLPLEVVSGESASCEVTDRGVTKARGITLLCDHLGIDRAEVACVGDSENDLCAFSCAGISFAMGNACPAVIDAADRVVADNGHGGIAQVVDYLLG